MAKFEVGKTYNSAGIEILIVKRTDKTVSFRFTKPCWWERNTEKVFRKKIYFDLEHETVHLGYHWSAPEITAEI